MPYWEPYSTVLTVEQSASVLSGYDVGGYAVSDGHDGDGDAAAGGPVFIAASVGGGKMRDCTRVYRNYKLELWGLPDPGHIKWTTKFCWNKWKRKAQYASNSMEMTPALRGGWELAGYRVDPHISRRRRARRRCEITIDNVDQGWSRASTDRVSVQGSWPKRLWCAPMVADA